MGSRRVIEWSTLILGLLTIFFVPADGIMCYQCSSINNTHIFQCTEFLSSDIDIKPTSCDNVHAAKYCVKRVGRIGALAIKCYQCTSAKQWTCSDGLLTMEAQQPDTCDHIYDAKYCIKATGRFGGAIGTERYCSSRNIGNVCDYPNLPGSEEERRTCVYTCSTDGCNPGTTVIPNILTIGMATLIMMCIFQR